MRISWTCRYSDLSATSGAEKVLNGCELSSLVHGNDDSGLTERAGDKVASLFSVMNQVYVTVQKEVGLERWDIARSQIVSREHLSSILLVLGSMEDS